MEKVYFYNKEGEKLAGVLHKPKKKTDTGIIICHGFKGNKDRDLIKNLDKSLFKKYNILRFDFSGNGESGGKFEDQCYSKYIEELTNAINFMKKENKEITMIGHSFGGNIVVLEEAKYKNIDKLILLAPALYDNGDILKLISTKGIIAFIKGSVNFKLFDRQLNKLRELKLNRRFFLDILFYHPKKAIKNVKKPILIILAEKDKVINLNKSISLCKKYNIKYSVVKGAAHNFREEKYLKEVSSKILKWL